MEIQFTWKTKLFRIKYEIIQNENIVGTLKGSGWKRKLPGELKGRKILFVTKGFFKVKNLIKSAEDDSLIGEISFNTWKSKAVITVQDKVYYFQFDNFFHTKWNISNENGSLIKYTGVSSIFKD